MRDQDDQIDGADGSLAGERPRPDVGVVNQYEIRNSVDIPKALSRMARCARNCLRRIRT